MADSYARKCDEIIASRIANAIYDTIPGYMEQAKYVAFIGQYRTANELGRGYDSKLNSSIKHGASELFGQSYFKLSSDEAGRIRHYLLWLGIEMPWLSSQQKRSEIMASKQFESMPCYPDKGFVKIINETLVIKFENLK